VLDYLADLEPGPRRHVESAPIEPRLRSHHSGHHLVVRDHQPTVFGTSEYETGWRGHHQDSDAGFAADDTRCTVLELNVRELSPNGAVLCRQESRRRV